MAARLRSLAGHGVRLSLPVADVGQCWYCASPTKRNKRTGKWRRACDDQWCVNRRKMARKLNKKSPGL